MIFTAITGMFPSCVHAVTQFLTLYIVPIALMLNPAVTIALHVILVPGITLLPDTVTLTAMDRQFLIVRPVISYPQQTSAVTGHPMKMAARNLKTQGKRHVCCTCSLRICSA